MPSKKLFIVLNNSTYRHFPGSTVAGQVIINNDRVQKIKGIKIVLVGVADVSFQGRSSQRHRASRTYSASEYIISSRVDLLLLNGAPTAKLQPGWHMYPFVFRLPNDIPSSFAGSKGKIEYKFTATMKRSFNINKTATLPLIISDFLDLNYEAQARRPIAVQMQKHFSFLRCTGPIEILLQVPKRGFASGENVTIAVDIDNQSSSNVKKCKIFLIQEVSFHAETKTSTSEQRKLLSISPSVPSGIHKMFAAVVKIPNVHATNLSSHSRRIINLQYFLELKLKFSFWENHFARRIPIIIGTVPLQDQYNSLPLHGSNLGNEVGSYNSIANPTGPTHYPTIAIVEPETSSYSRITTHSPCPSPISMVGQDFDSASIYSGMSLPPAYENFADLPPSYADAIKMELAEDDD